MSRSFNTSHDANTGNTKKRPRRLNKKPYKKKIRKRRRKQRRSCDNDDYEYEDESV